MVVRTYSCEVAFAVPEILSNEQLDAVRDHLATQYADVACVYAGVCNPPLITITTSDVPTEPQEVTMERQIRAIAELVYGNTKRNRG